MDDKKFSEQMNPISEGSRWKRIDDGAIGTILEIRDDNSNNLVVRWTHPSFEGSRTGECDRHEFVRKWVQLESHPVDSVETIKVEDEDTKRLKSKYHKIAKELRDLAKECHITVGSIWRNVNGAEEYKGRLIKVVSINGDSIRWRYLANAEGCPKIGPNMCSTKTTSDSFLYSFDKVQDNDNGAIYQPFDRVHDVKENPDKYQMVKVVETNVTTTPEDFAYGMIKYITIPIASNVYSVTLGKFHSEFELVSLNPVEEFCTDTNDSGKLIDPNKGESKMEDNETYLKTDKDKLEDFGTGAKREDKSGKGRYDLIPGDIMADFVNYAWETYFNEGPMTICDTDVSIATYFDDVTDEELFFEFILNMTCLFFTDHNELEETTDCVGERSYVVTWEAFHEALYEMRALLAKHYEAGAKVHGVNNWKKGIPISDSERGGNFVDSMRRHADQALLGLDDEPHAISAIWNAFSAIWTIRNKPTSTTNSSEYKAERVTNESNHLDEDIEYLTLPSGRKIRVQFLHSTTDDEKDVSFLKALGLNDDLINNIMEYIKKGNQLEDK